jgi:NADPH:quinone reductase-like Zn-dependent oxidoreductase
VREPRNRVVQVRRFGGPDGLEVVDALLPTAGRGEVRVRVLASGLEYTDVVIRRRLYPQTMRRRPPFVLGYDVVGEIDQRFCAVVVLGAGLRAYALDFQSLCTKCVNGGCRCQAHGTAGLSAKSDAALTAQKRRSARNPRRCRG